MRSFWRDAAPLSVVALLWALLLSAHFALNKWTEANVIGFVRWLIPMAAFAVVVFAGRAGQRKLLQRVDPDGLRWARLTDLGASKEDDPAPPRGQPSGNTPGYP